MNEDEVEERLRSEAVRLAAPFLNGHVLPRPTPTQSDRGLEVLWDEGYVPARDLLIAEGIPAAQVEAQMTKVKKLLDIIEPSDLISFPYELHAELVADLEAVTLPPEAPSV